VQLGAQLFDLRGIKRAHLTALIKPSGWEMEPEAEAVHGISTQDCHRYGISLPEALVPLRGLVQASGRIVAHHMNFDRRVIGAAIHRAGGEGVWWHRAGAKMFCTMEASTPVLKLPGQFGGDKFPSLEEAVAGLCPGQELPVKHDADSDIAACHAVYRALVAGGYVQDFTPFARSIA
jgi:DNA polymerase III epsilon subunit-like protein